MCHDGLAEDRRVLHGIMEASLTCLARMFAPEMGSWKVVEVISRAYA
jgi:hypothetical protein